GPEYLLIPHAKQSENEITTAKFKNRKKRAKRSLIPNLRMSVFTTRYKPGLESFLLSCHSPRTPYIFAPRSVYAFTFLPLSRHSIKWRYSIFSDLRNYLQNFVFIRGNLTFILPCAPNVNRPTVYGFWLRNRRMGLESRFRSLWAVFRLEAFTATSFDKEQNFRGFYRKLGRYVAIVLGLSVVRLPYSSSSVAGFRYVYVTLGQPVFDSIEI
ncbi:hypothetical protein IGI04_035025, partial [Brassica rapa subsp. trilocularis]